MPRRGPCYEALLEGLSRHGVPQILTDNGKVFTGMLAHTRASMGIPGAVSWQRFLTAASTISVINSIVVGVLAGAVVHDAFTSSDALSFSAGALATLLCFWAFQ